MQLPGGEAQLAEIVRILDQADLRVETLQLHQPSLDDVFLAKTGRKLEGAGRGGRARDGRSGDAVAVEIALGPALRASGRPRLSSRRWPSPRRWSARSASARC